MPRNRSDQELKEWGGARVSAKPKCSARRTNGEPCGNYPIRGGTVCTKHGGGAPQVRAKAAERILGAADLAAKRLIEFMSDKNVPASVRLAAARDLLDRAGVGHGRALEVNVSVWDTIMADGGGILYDLDPSNAPTTMVPIAPSDRDEMVVEAEIVEVAREQEHFALSERAREERRARTTVSMDPPSPPTRGSVPYSGNGHRPVG